MSSKLIVDFLFLILLFFVGYFIFKVFKIPIPQLLGTLALIGSLKVIGFELPKTPSFLGPLVQILIGIYSGGTITRDKYKEIKKIFFPVIYLVPGYI